ncbi:MAG: PAS domain-containing protein [Chloroflexi bacterium]|nr:PAS domain-containing protein [Chloroflexota bacterium]
MRIAEGILGNTAIPGAGIPSWALQRLRGCWRATQRPAALVTGGAPRLPALLPLLTLVSGVAGYGVWSGWAAPGGDLLASVVVFGILSGGRSPDEHAAVLTDQETVWRMQRRLRELEGLTELGRIGSAGSPPDVFFGTLTALVARLLGAQACAVFLAHPQATVLRPAVPACGIGDDALAAAVLSAEPGTVAAALLEGSTLGTAELATDPTLRTLHHVAAGGGAASAIAIRFRGHGEPIGVLVLFNKVDGADFDADDRRLLDMVVAQIGPTIEGFQRYRESEEQRQMLHAALDHMVDGIVVVDAGGRVLYANRALMRHWRKPIYPGALRNDFMRNERFYDLEGNLVRFARLPLSRALGQGETTRHERFAYARSDDQWNYYDISCTPLFDDLGRVTSAVSVFRDITQQVAGEQERERLLEELAISEGRLRVILETMDDAVVVFRGDTVVLANRRYRELFGFERDIVGRAAPDLAAHMIHCFADTGAYFAARRQATTTPESLITTDLETVWPEHRFLRRVSSPVPGPDGDYFGRIVLYRDITDLRNLEQKKDAFMLTVGYELQEPLTIIKGYGALLQRRLAGLHGSRDVLRRIGLDLEAVGQQVANLSTETDRLLYLVEQFQDLVRLDTEEPSLKPVDLVGLVDEVVAQLGPELLLRRVRVHRPPAGQSLTVLGDERRLRQALYALVHNAAQYSPPTEAILVSLIRQEQESRQEAPACVTVQDFGIGLEPGEATQVFERFYRGEHARALAPRGLGINLYRAATIVRRHRGEIRAESDGPGRGSRFTVQLPLLL